jgi:AraC-like DNA-binding protein
MATDVDVLSQVAEVLRLRGSVSWVFAIPSPWGYAMPKMNHAKLLVVTRGRVYFEMNVGKSQVLELAPGDVIALPHGHAYTIRDDPRTPLKPPPDLGSCGTSRAESPRGGQTEFVGLCCEFAGGRTNPILRVLPPFIHCPGNNGSVARWLEPTVRLIAAESTGSSPGRTTILDRLAEVAFIQLIRVWLESLPAGEGGWLRALTDHQLAGAIEAIHSEPGSSWTVASLASRASMSRSAFAGRFKNLVGETPLEYLTRWRMQRAAGLLESDDVPLKEIVASSGYTSEAAFRTVFKKWVGESPGSYRARARAT